MWKAGFVVVAMLLAVPGPAQARQPSVTVSAFRTCHSVETRIEVTKGASGTVTVRGQMRPWSLRRAGQVEVSIPLHHSKPAADAVVVGSFGNKHRTFVRVSEYGFGEPCPT